MKYEVHVAWKRLEDGLELGNDTYEFDAYEEAKEYFDNVDLKEQYDNEIKHGARLRTEGKRYLECELEQIDDEEDIEVLDVKEYGLKA